MRVREITEIAENTMIELPNSDALFMVRNQKSLTIFAKHYGNMEVIQAGNVYTVPAFKASRDEFRAAKLSFCQEFGCE